MNQAGPLSRGPAEGIPLLSALDCGMLQCAATTAGVLAAAQNLAGMVRKRRGVRSSACVQFQGPWFQSSPAHLWNVADEDHVPSTLRGGYSDTGTAESANLAEAASLKKQRKGQRP